MRRRLLIARALIHRPPLVLLDEPTVGLDPQVRQELWALIDALRTEGTSILMSTHYIEEAERLCDTVAIISHGPGGRRRAARPTCRRARRPRGGRGLRLHRPAWRRWRPRWRAAGPPDAAHRHLDRGAARSTAPAGRAPGGRAPAGQPRGRLRPAHRRGDRLSTAAPPRRAGPSRAPGAGGRARARDHQLQLVLALDHLLLDGRADDLPARLRLRLRVAGRDRRRVRLRRVRRHRDGRDRRPVLVRPSRRCSGRS